MSGQPNNMKSLLQIMRDSLVQKNILLQAIEQKSKEQEAIVKKENFTFKEIDENMDAKFLLESGNRVMIKRKLFEEFLDNSSVI